MQEDSYKEKTSTPRKGDQPSTTIKAPMPLQIKVRIIYPLGILELWEKFELDLRWVFGRHHTDALC